MSISSEKRIELEKRIATLKNVSDKEKLKQEEDILKANYFSVIEGHQKKIGWRKVLAEKIGVSGAYLSQIFTGEKPLNFRTLAKIQRVLNVRFRVELIDMSIWTITTSNMPSNAINDLSKLPPITEETTISNLNNHQIVYEPTKEKVFA